VTLCDLVVFYTVLLSLEMTSLFVADYLGRFSSGCTGTGFKGLIDPTDPVVLEHRLAIKQG
jgi:hypothetical protein